MSQGEYLDEPSSGGRPSPLESPDKRVDPAHVRADERPAVDERVEPADAKAAPVERTASVTAHQVQLQAAQLASHLQRHQSMVDHRESELNARVAAMENQIRAARLWLDERHAELAARTAELDRRERELAQHEQEPDDREETERAAALDRREVEIEQRAARLDQRLQQGEQPGEPRHAADSLETFRANLERAESLLSDQQAEQKRERGKLADSRDKLAQAIRRQREKLADERRRFVVEHDCTRRQLDRQTDELAARHAALARMQADVARAQEEALEMRLATEEMWARLSGKMAPAALAQSLAQYRLKLAEEQQLARSQSAAERAEVQALASRVAQQHDRLLDEREQVQAWVKARREELERYAAMLAQREQELDNDRAAFEQKTAQRQSERFRLEQEIRRLLRQAGGAQSVAAA